MSTQRLPIAILFAIGLTGLFIFYAPYVTAQWAISPWGDTIYLTGPLFCEISRGVNSGAIPLMNWSTLEAIDYNPHVAAYYPFYLFGWLEFCSPAAAAQVADYIAVLHIFIFACTMASFIRATGAGIAASFGGAVIAAALPNTIALANFPTFIAVAAWLPLAAEGLFRIAYRREHSFGALLLAIGVSLMLAAGPGTNLITCIVIFGAVIGAERLLFIVREKNLYAGAWMIGALAAAAVLTIFLSAASTVNLYTHIDEFIRWTRTGSVVGSASANAQEILAEQLSWRDLLQLILPVNASYAVGKYLIGPAALLLAAVGLIGRWPQAMIRVNGIVALICVVLVFLSPARLVMLWAFIPGLSHTRHLSLLGTPLAISVGVLAAHGLDLFINHWAQMDRRRIGVLLGVTFILLMACLAGLIGNTNLRSTSSAGFLAFVVAATAAVFVTLLIAPRNTVRQFGISALHILNFAYLHGSLPRSDGVPAVTGSATWQSVEATLDRIISTDPEPGRIAIHNSVAGPNLNFLQTGSIATYRGIETFSHYTSPRIFWKFEHEIGLVADSRFAPFGGKYLLSIAELPSTIGQMLFQIGDVKTYLLADSRPLVEVFCLHAADTSAMATTAGPAGQLPLLAGGLAAQLTSAQAKRDGTDCGGNSVNKHARLDRTSNALRFGVELGGERALVINLPPYRSWHFDIGGGHIPLYNLNRQQLVAILPDHASGEAVLSYQPNRYKVLLWISGVSWALTLAALITILIRRRRAPMG